jgi:CheY-like chemotaxis protein
MRQRVYFDAIDRDVLLTDRCDDGGFNLRRVLIVEDDAMFQKILKNRFEKHGFAITITPDGLEGLDIARREKPDLIVLDLLLPKMDGHKICRLIKLDQRLQSIPVAIFTSRDMDEDAELAKASGADAFIVKTTRAEVMMDVLKRLLEKNGKTEED